MARCQASFLSDFPQGLVIPLGTSYRLPSHILATAETIFQSSSTDDYIQSPMESLPLSPAARNALERCSPHLVKKKENEWEKRVMIKELWDPVCLLILLFHSTFQLYIIYLFIVFSELKLNGLLLK